MTRQIKLLVVLAAILGGLSVTTACGQKGPLFLPDTTDNTKSKETAASQEQEKTKKGSSGSGY